MYQLVIGVGIAYFFLREGRKSSPKPEPVPEPDPEPQPSPEPPVQEWTETAEWSGEYVSGENVVWFFRKGIRYTDGTAEFSDTTYIVIGDANHHNFLSANSDRGTIDIKWEFTGNPSQRDSENVVVFATLEDAERKADELTNPPPRDPTDPVQPQPEPEEDEEDDQGGFSLPTRPDYGLGGGSRLFTNGGF